MGVGVVKLASIAGDGLWGGDRLSLFREKGGVVVKRAGDLGFALIGLGALFVPNGLSPMLFS